MGGGCGMLAVPCGTLCRSRLSNIHEIPRRTIWTFEPNRPSDRGKEAEIHRRVSVATVSLIGGGSADLAAHDLNEFRIEVSMSDLAHSVRLIRPPKAIGRRHTTMPRWLRGPNSPIPHTSEDTADRGRTQV